MLVTNRYKIFLFKLIAVFAVVFFFIAIELVVRWISPVNIAADDLINIGNLSFFTPITHKGENYIKITNKYGYPDQHVMFRKKKHTNTIRIFCIGGSACAGWPHPMDERFSSYLQTYLQKIYPFQKFEVINCAAHGFASYRVRKVFQALLPYQPDAVIVWCGNNEFLEDRKYISSGFGKIVDHFAGKIKTVQVLKHLFSKPQLNGNELNVSNAFWKKVQQESLELRSNPKLFDKVKFHYRSSLEKIAEEASANGIKTLFFTVPVNLKDWEPNVSYCSLKGADSVEWARKVLDGRSFLFKNDLTNAKDKFLDAIEHESLHAHSYFWLARVYDALNDSVTALKNYSIARDLDYNPFRAISDFNQIVKKIAVQHQDAYLFDADSLFKANSIRGIPGFDLFLDYVHPTRFGNILLAVNLGKYIRQKDLFNIKSPSVLMDQKEFETSLSDYSDEKDVKLQITRFSLFCLTHQYISSLNLGKWILSILPESYLNDSSNQHELQKLKDGIEAFSMFCAADENVLSKRDKKEEMQHAKLMVKKFYERYYPYGSY